MPLQANPAHHAAIVPTVPTHLSLTCPVPTLARGAQRGVPRVLEGVGQPQIGALSSVQPRGEQLRTTDRMSGRIFFFGFRLVEVA